MHCFNVIMCSGMSFLCHHPICMGIWSHILLQHFCMLWLLLIVLRGLSLTLNMHLLFFWIMVMFIIDFFLEKLLEVITSSVLLLLLRCGTRRSRCWRLHCWINSLLRIWVCLVTLHFPVVLVFMMLSLNCLSMVGILIKLLIILIIEVSEINRFQSWIIPI